MCAHGTERLPDRSKRFSVVPNVQSSLQPKFSGRSNLVTFVIEL